VLAADAREVTQAAVVGRTGGRGECVRPPRGGRAGRETGCPGNGWKRGLVRGQPSEMAATERVGGAFFRQVLFPVISSLMRTVPWLMWDRAVNHVG
jgi:hypothetical protein